MYNLAFILSLWMIQQDQFSAQVTSVQDGDTMEVIWNDKKVMVRLFGVDCPEDGQGFSTKARQYVEATCRNKTVKVVKHTIDPRGRIVGDVIMPDGKSLAKELLKAGYAWHYKEYSNDKELEGLEQKARKEKKGLWIENNPVAPWDYKKAKQKAQ